MSELFRTGLPSLLELPQRLLDEVLPDLRGRAHAVDLQHALDRHIRETEDHVANLKRVAALTHGTEVAGTDDLALLGEILRIEALEVASYELLVQAALALELDAEAVHLLRLNMEQDAYTGEQAEHALAKLLAEATASR
jgi:ferritin-like metal-binding protein YciE